MKNLISKKVIAGAFVVAGLFTGVQANGNEVSLETAISQAVVAQGEQLINGLNAEVERSIEKHLKSFNLTSTLALLEQESTEQAEDEPNVEQLLKSESK